MQLLRVNMGINVRVYFLTQLYDALLVSDTFSKHYGPIHPGIPIRHVSYCPYMRIVSDTLYAQLPNLCTWGLCT